MKKLLIGLLVLGSISSFAVDKYIGNGISVTSDSVVEQNGMTVISQPFFYVEGDRSNTILIKATKKNANKTCGQLSLDLVSYTSEKGHKVYGFSAVKRRMYFDISKPGKYLTSVTCE